MSGLLDNPIALITVLLCIVIIFNSLKYTNKDSESFVDLFNTTKYKDNDTGNLFNDSNEDETYRRFKESKEIILNTNDTNDTNDTRLANLQKHTPEDSRVTRQDIYNPQSRCIINKYDTRKHYGILNDYHDACTVPDSSSGAIIPAALNTESPTSYHNLQQFCIIIYNKFLIFRYFDFLIEYIF